LHPPERLTDGTVILRRMREGDRAAVLEAMRDPVVRRWLNMPTAPGDREFDTVMRTVATGFRTGERYDFCVVTDDDEPSRGAVIASRRHRDNYEVAYFAGERGRGHGLMTRAVVVLCDWLLEEGVGRIEIRTHPDNAASQRLAERAGFTREGRERKSIWLHGERHDAIVWSRLPGDPRPQVPSPA
jgi:RimJ/RimL family protein N-acetyltransferase